MGRIRGFLLKHRVSTLFLRFFQRKCSPAGHRRLNPYHSDRVKPLSRLISWTQHLRTKARAIVSRNHHSGRGYVRLGREPVVEKPLPLPKGHIAVYVGQKDGDFQRILMPVVYFNHPLFGDLLKESEKEYGFDHAGGITIPCRISDFERIQTRIKAVHCTRKLLTWKRFNRSSKRSWI